MTTEAVWRTGGWERRDYPTVMAGWVVRYTIDHGTQEKQEISASRERVIAHRVNINSDGDGARVIDIIRRAWRQHEHLARNPYNKPLSEMDVMTGGAVVAVEGKGEQV